MLTTVVKNDLGVALVEREKIAVEVLDLSPVSDVLARQLAKADSKAGKGLSENDYYGFYHAQGVLNLTAKYTYTNSKGKRDVFIASSLLNDDECSVRFNGYMTLSREF
ncbi:Shiga toxin A subunit [Enterobacteriaceae bacterium RIT691]|nr:Shiga toxin A subunit [Enterobacteriaceae bacterium RIT691]